MTRAGHPRCHECSSAFCKRQVETRIVEAVLVFDMILPISHQLPAALRAISDEMTHASRLRGEGLQDKLESWGSCIYSSHVLFVTSVMSRMGWPPTLETSLLCCGQDMVEIEFMYICLSASFSGSPSDLIEP
ncbi:hypothetical protein V3481_018102 [Fusarium oxysporum f. sp. vasinfectum]